MGNVQSVRARLLANWSWFEDYLGPGGRIWLSWNELEVGVEVLMVDKQFIHCSLVNKRTSTNCLISVVYEDCDSARRRLLWGGLQSLSEGITDVPCYVLGDFNAVIDSSESCGRVAEVNNAIAEFREFITEAALVHLPFTGCPYTWHNCSEGSRSLWRRLDRVLVNEVWLEKWPLSSYLSVFPSVLDHSPLVLLGSERRPEVGVFRFDNFLASQLNFLNSMRSVWEHHIYGTKNVWSGLQAERKINARRAEQRIYQISNSTEDTLTEPDQVVAEFLSFYETLLGGLRQQRALNFDFLQPHLKHTLSIEEANELILPITPREIKEVFFDISEDRRLLKQLNATLLALIPRVQLPVRVSEFRPIACCNVVYKATSKVLVRRTFDSVRTIKSTLAELAEMSSLHVIPNQSTIILSKAVQRERQGILDVMGFQEGSLPINGPPKEFRKKAVQVSILYSLVGSELGGGLHVNPQKSHLILFRSASTHWDIFLPILGYQEGHLPLRYLGLPLLPSRLTIADCKPILQKIEDRIKGWERIMLSFVGRVQLIKSVLIALQVYWAMAFILPKTVIREIERRIRSLLWKGGTGVGYVKVSWQQACCPISEGGLGIRDILALNRGFMSIHLWRIGSRDSFSLWHDPWHDLGPLILRFRLGSRHTATSPTAPLSLVIRDDRWHWPPITDMESIEITHTLPPIHGGQDRVVWTGPRNSFTSTAAYDVFHPSGPTVEWSLLLVGSLKIPTHWFILCLAILGRLSTMDKPWLQHLGTDCVLCRASTPETHGHLFFSCPLRWSARMRYGP
ncbi:UNVERIFIED_CONTAM: hypothetical protein Sradi_2065700 [Sesamum radiatum]|uniref:Reverse transcriptase zinc-binding domain-containing protein n=1 Tax=Sesamum radiatum TaxID=300843 RepID=A0AAW2THX1_SESRA